VISWRCSDGQVTKKKVKNVALYGNVFKTTATLLSDKDNCHKKLLRAILITSGVSGDIRGDDVLSFFAGTMTLNSQNYNQGGPSDEIPNQDVQ
jgi:hypothetical protein